MRKNIVSLVLLLFLFSPIQSLADDQWDLSQFLIGGAGNLGNTDAILFNAGLKYENDREEDGLEDKWRIELNHRSDFEQEGLSIAGVEYEYLLSERFYISPQVDFARNGNNDLDYQFVISPAVGYYLMRDDTHRLSVEFAPGYLFQERGDIESDTFLPLFGNRFLYLFGSEDQYRLFQSARLLIPADEPEDVIIDGEIGVDVPVSEDWLMVFEIENFFQNNAPSGKSNDIDFVLSLAREF